MVVDETWLLLLADTADGANAIPMRYELALGMQENDVVCMSLSNTESCLRESVGIIQKQDAIHERGRASETYRT